MERFVKVLQVLDEAGGELSFTDLRKMYEKDGKTNYGYFVRSLKEMSDEGFIEKKVFWEKNGKPLGVPLIIYRITDKGRKALDLFKS
jgi:DNA-binding PadR family transcriptional regulator